MENIKTYLGDGVYVEFDGNGLILTTENGVEIHNTIYLESETFRALLAFYERLKDGAK